MRFYITGNKHSSRMGILLFGALFIFFLLTGIAYADHRVSASYIIPLDSISMAGGASSSASYHQTQSSVGQESVCGFSDSASYRSYEGVIQAWGSACVWMLY